MTDQTIYEPGVGANSAAPATEAPLAPAGAGAGEAATSPASAPAVPAGAVMLTAEQFAALLSAARQPVGATAESVGAQVVRIAPDNALKVGDPVLHKGRAAVILEVLLSDRVEGDKSWTQVSYRVGVFAEDRTLPAEDFGAF